MNEFPENLSLTNCMKIIETNQKKWTKEVRKDFYDKILKASEICDREVILEFPDNLWPEHKSQITKELLNIFGELIIKVNQKANNAVTTRLISDESDISKEINMVIIQFHK